MNHYYHQTYNLFDLNFLLSLLLYQRKLFSLRFFEYFSTCFANLGSLLRKLARHLEDQTVLENSSVNFLQFIVISARFLILGL